MSDCSRQEHCMQLICGSALYNYDNEDYYILAKTLILFEN